MGLGISRILFGNYSMVIFYQQYYMRLNVFNLGEALSLNIIISELLITFE